MEQTTFWAQAGFWLGSMAIRELSQPDPAVLWRQLSPSVFMGLTISVVMAFLWFDTVAALRRSLLLTIGSTVIGGLYFARRPGVEGEYLIDLIRYEIYLAITAVFVYALARSKDALMDTRMEVEQMRTMAYRDPLTGLANRRFALDELNRLSGLRVRAGVVLVDLEEFRGINDRLGHEVGDLVLVRVATLLAHTDARIASRWGGEEFLLVFDGGADAAAGHAERVREQLSALPMPEDVVVTASFGVAELTPGTDVVAVLRIADERMYQAKSAGRNRVRWTDAPSGAPGSTDLLS